VRARPRLTALLLAASLPGGCWSPAAGADETPAAPESRDGPRLPVETIEVRDRPDDPLILDPTAFATVLRADEFAHRIVTLADLLRETVGVQVRDLGSEFATVSIRGSSAEQVVVYLDGVPLNRALGGGVNLADLPLAQVESIAVYRGFTPAGLPAASIGGAVMIRTRRPGSAPAASLYLQGGSFGGAEAGGSLAAARGRADLALAFDAGRSAGDYAFFDDNATPHDATDDGRSRRINNDFARGHLTGSASFRLARGARLGFTADLLRREQGVPGKDAAQNPRARYAAWRGLLRADLEAPGLLGGRLLARAAADLTHHAEAYENPDLRDETRTRIGSAGQEAGLTFLASRRVALSLLLAHRVESAALRKEFTDQPDDLGTARRRDLVATLEAPIALAADRVLLNPSVRLERWSGDFTPGPGTAMPPDALDREDGRATAKIGFRARLGERLALKGNAGRFYRIPDFIELFGYSGAVRGNPALLPEHGRSLDLGLEASLARDGRLLRRARLSATVFETLAEDLILFVPRSQFSVVAENFGRARIRGAEIDLFLGIGRRLTGGLNATLQRAVNESGDPNTGRLLPGRPSREAGVSAGLALGRGRLFYGFTYVGRNFTDPANTDSIALPARYLHDLGYRLDLRDGREAVFEVKNIGDDLIYDVAGYPLPGRSFQARLTWRR
jgi:iron complex outermembrane receptor protein